MPLDPLDPDVLLAEKPYSWAVPSREVEFSYRLFATEEEAYDYIGPDDDSDIKPQPLFAIDMERIAGELDILRISNASLAKVNSQLNDAIVETAKFAGVYSGPSNLWCDQLLMLLDNVRSRIQELQTACRK